MKNFEVKDLLFINKMITPTILNILYWIVSIVIVVAGIGSIFSGAIIRGVLMIPFGLLYARILFELMMVMFKINESVARIANRLDEKDK